MIASRRMTAAALPLIGIAWALRPAQAQADDVRVMQSAPQAHAVIDGRSSQFFVHFDRPVDHVRSTLEIVQDGRVIERLQPRLESAPNVLFAQAPTLPPGDYKLHWAVRTLVGAKVMQGDIPFSVAAQR